MVHGWAVAHRLSTRMHGSTVLYSGSGGHSRGCTRVKLHTAQPCKHPVCSATDQAVYSRAQTHVSQTSKLAIRMHCWSERPIKRQSAEKDRLVGAPRVWYLATCKTMCVHACCCEIEELGPWSQDRRASACDDPGSGRGPKQDNEQVTREAKGD